MLLDQIGGQMRRTRPARAGQTIAIDDEDLVGNRLQTVELLEKVGMVEPAHTATVAVHQARPMQNEGAGEEDRTRVVEGKGVSVRLDLGGRRRIKKKKQHNNEK